MRDELREEIEVEVEQQEAGDFEDQLLDEALDRLAVTALSNACHGHCGSVLGPLRRRGTARK